MFLRGRWCVWLAIDTTGYTSTKNEECLSVDRCSVTLYDTVGRGVSGRST